MIFQLRQTNTTKNRFDAQFQDLDWSPTQNGFLGLKLYRAGSGFNFNTGSDAPYVIAFGLNLATSKIHFEVAQWTPVHSQYRLSEYQNSVEFPKDNKVHLYTLVIKLNGIFSIRIDGVEVID